jgi:hypothetical protein
MKTEDIVNKLLEDSAKHDSEALEAALAALENLIERKIVTVRHGDAYEEVLDAIEKLKYALDMSSRGL